MPDDPPDAGAPEGRTPRVDPADLRKDERKDARRRDTGRDDGRDDVREGAYEDMFEDGPRPERTGDAPRPSRLARLGRRLLNSGDDVRDLASAVLDSGDRAKTEMVRMVAREVRTYLDELKLKDVVTKHSLEVHMSFSLKPLVGESDDKAAGSKSDPKKSS